MEFNYQKIGLLGCKLSFYMWESFYLVCVLECALELHHYWEGIQERIGKNLDVTYIERLSAAIGQR